MEDRHYDEHTYVHKYRNGEGGVESYNDLEDKPQINGTTLTGNKSASDLGLAVPNDIPTKVSELENDTGFITSSSLPTKVSDLENDTGFITSDALPTKLSDLENDEGFVSGTDFTGLYFIKEWFTSVSFSTAFSSIITRIQTELGTILASLGDNEYITLEQLIITNLVAITPERKVILKKGDTVPTYRLQGCSFGTDEIVFVDVNNNLVVHYANIGTTPAQDYSDDYTSDVTAISCQILYNKYQKGV